MTKQTTHIIPDWRKHLFDLCIKITVYCLAWMEYRSFRSVDKVMKLLTRLGNEISGTGKVPRVVNINGRFYWNLHIPGFPSKIWLNYIRGEMNRIIPVRSKYNRLVILFLCVTKKCPLKCQHCYEWDELNGKETLTLEDMRTIGARFQQSGVAHIHLGGGEPMARFDDTVELIRYLSPCSEVWMATCGSVA